MLTPPPLQKRELTQPTWWVAETENKCWECGDFEASEHQLPGRPDHSLGVLLSPSQTPFTVSRLQQGL